MAHGDYLPSKIFEGFIGLVCESIIYGSGSGSRLVIKFGDKVARKKPLLNKFLSEIDREFEFTHAIFIKNASWRLLFNEIIVSSSSMDNSNNNECHQNLLRIKGSCIEKFIINSITKDCYIEFKNGFILEVFCMVDYSEGCAADENYSIRSVNQRFKA
jgi:hypothetical protein